MYSVRGADLQIHEFVFFLPVDECAHFGFLCASVNGVNSLSLGLFVVFCCTAKSIEDYC